MLHKTFFWLVFLDLNSRHELYHRFVLLNHHTRTTAASDALIRDTAVLWRNPVSHAERQDPGGGRTLEGTGPGTGPRRGRTPEETIAVGVGVLPYVRVGGQWGGLKTKPNKKSTGLLPQEEALVDVRLQEPGVTISGHQAVDELLRRVE